MKDCSHILLCLALASAASAAEPALHLVPRESWSNVFGGRETAFHFSATSGEASAAKIGWRLSANERTIARGEQAVDLQAGIPETVEIRLPVPEVKEGVVFPCTLSVSLFAEGAAGAVTNIDKTLWAFCQDPFAGRADWLKGLAIALFDPEDKTAERFEQAKIPFDIVRNPDAVNGLTNGMLVVGETVSLRDFRSLPDTMLEAAAKGIPVLCLAPSEGELMLPGVGNGAAAAPKSLSFRRADMITALDKRLDAEAWPPDGRVVAGSLKLRGDRGPVVVETGEDGTGWPWMELTFGGRGRLVLCTFPVIGKWDVSPTPRFLLSVLLEHLDQAGKVQTTQGGGQ